MAKYCIGDKVINVKSQEKGVITDVFPGGRGRQLYSVRYRNEENNSLETKLIPDTDITDPFENTEGYVEALMKYYRTINDL